MVGVIALDGAAMEAGTGDGQTGVCSTAKQPWGSSPGWGTWGFYWLGTENS